MAVRVSKAVVTVKITAKSVFYCTKNYLYENCSIFVVVSPTPNPPSPSLWVRCQLYANCVACVAGVIGEAWEEREREKGGEKRGTPLLRRLLTVVFAFFFWGGGGGSQHAKDVT